MSDNALCTPPRLNDSAICQRLAQFLQETEADPQSVGLAIAVVGIDGELIAFGAHARCPALPRQLAQRKAWSALRFRRPTARLAEPSPAPSPSPMAARCAPAPAPPPAPMASP